MKIIDYEQAVEWLSRRGLNPGNGFQDQFPGIASFEIPSDTGRRTAMARLLADEVCSMKRPGLLLVTGWGVWPSGENWALFSMVRRGMGEGRTVADAPGHVFESEDRSELECMLDIILYFLWDAVLVIGNGSIICHFSHDEFILLRGEGGSALADALRRGGYSS